MTEIRQDEIIKNEIEINRIQTESMKKLKMMRDSLETLEATVLKYKDKLAKYESSNAASDAAVARAVADTGINPSLVTELLTQTSAISEPVSFTLTVSEHPAELIFMGPSSNSTASFNVQPPPAEPQSIAQIETDEKAALGIQLHVPAVNIIR